jgi:hypothetical protein
MNVTLNHERRLYVIACESGSTCLGFDAARDHAAQIAERLGQTDLAFACDDEGTLAGYAKYRAAIDAWGRSGLSQTTYFDPGTDAKVARALERCRRSNAKVRLVLGDADSGRCWLDEYDVVGHIGRSAGTLKVPLLIEPGAEYGTAILTACLLRIIDWNSGRDLYRHPAFRTPDLSICRAGASETRWQVMHEGTVVASFRDIGKAGAYLAFMGGESVEPRIFQ